MKDLQKINLSLNSRRTKPSVYALELTCRELSYLYLTSAYSLEEAIMLAKKQILFEFAKTSIPPTEWQLRKYVYSSLESLISQNSLINIDIHELKIDKNKLMKRIIEEKNTKLLNINKKLFTIAEKKMLLDAIAKI